MKIQPLNAIFIKLVFASLLSFFLLFDSFKIFPKKFYDKDELIKAVVPNKNYSYWAFCENIGQSIIFSKGIKPINLKIKNPGSGLFAGCKPLNCYNYIVYVYGGKVGYIITSAQFKDFVGRIDNLEEAVLIAEETENLQIDQSNRKGGSYLEDENVYSMRLMKFNSCPESKESIFVKYQKGKGLIEKKSLGFYFKSKNCIVY